MPFVNGRYYMNPFYGSALEAAREAENRSSDRDAGEPDANGHWVTIDHRHVLIHEPQSERVQHPSKNPRVSERDQKYLDKYYDFVVSYAKKYKVDPALVLGVGIESGFAEEGTYLRTGDAFGMTGGSTKHMTHAATPEQNVQEFFQNYGKQIRGTGNNMDAFIDGLQGRDPMGDPVHGWKVYKSDRPAYWEKFIRSGIHQMQRDVPTYAVSRRK